MSRDCKNGLECMRTSINFNECNRLNVWVHWLEQSIYISMVWIFSLNFQLVTTSFWFEHFHWLCHTKITNSSEWRCTVLSYTTQNPTRSMYLYHYYASNMYVLNSLCYFFLLSILTFFSIDFGNGSKPTKYV